MKFFPLFSMLTASAALAGQIVLVFFTKSLFIYRAVVVLALIAIFLYGWSMKKRRPTPLSFRILASLGGSGLFWITALELALCYTLVLARGLFLVTAAFQVHALILFIGSRSGRGEGPRARVFLRAWLCLSMIGLLLFVTEAVFRMAVPLQLYELIPDDPSKGPLYVIDLENRRLVPRPGFKGKYMHPDFPGIRVELNAYGLRDDPEEASPPLPGEGSVLVLGDSLAFGTGVSLEDTFQEKLEQELPPVVGRPVRVYGASLPGYAQYHELLFLNDFAEKTLPDAVVVALYEGNDLDENVKAETIAKIPLAILSEAEKEQPALERKDPELTRYLEGLTRFRFWNGSSAAAQFFFRALEAGLVRLGWMDPFIPTNRFLEDCLTTPPPQAVKDGLDQTLVLLRKIASRCEELQARLLVLMIPSVIQAEPARYEEYEACLPEGRRGRMNRTFFHDHLRSAMEEAGLCVVDMLPLLERESLEGRSGYHREGHWNAHGHALAAQRLLPYLARILAEP